MSKKNIILLIFLSLFISLNAVQVKKVEARYYKNFEKGELKGTSIDSQGRLFLGPQIKTIKGPEREYYLSADISRNGDLYIGTGHQSILYRVNSQTQAVEKIFESEQLDFYALLINRNNEIYVGSSPNGKVYHIDKKKKVKVVFDPDNKFIWEIKEDRNGDIICAVGNSGGLYRLKVSGEVSKICETEDFHLISLYITRDNSILAGSGDRGVLYKIENRKVKVLYDSPLEEIRGICEDKEGNIYFSATRGIVRKKHPETIDMEPIFSKDPEEMKKYIKEKSILYCLQPNGTVEPIWSSLDDYIYTICYDPNGNSVLVGTGNSGRIYRVKKDGGFSLVYESESAQVYKIIRNNNGFTIISNNTAAIANLGENVINKGSFLSEIYDLEVQSKLGRVYWDSDTSPSMKVTLFVRAGNSNIADNTWTDWSPPFADGQNSSINITGYRYFQIKVMLNSSNIGGTPYLNDYRVYYLQTNLKPRMKTIEIKKSNHKKSRLNQKKNTSKPGKYLQVKWMAQDPNNDELKYSVYLKKTSDRNWIPIKMDFGENTLKLDMELFEDGLYVMKVNVDDSLDNPPSTSISASKISKSFLIDSTAPRLSELVRSGNQIKFKVMDLTSLISEVLYSYDGKLWYPVIPDDMINDSKLENYMFRLKPVNKRKNIFIKIVDEFGNSKVYQKEL